MIYLNVIESVFSVIALVFLIKDRILIKKLRAQIEKERSQHRVAAETYRGQINIQKSEIDRQRETIREMESGWFPATYENSRRKYGGTLRRRGSSVRVSVNIFTMYGVVTKEGNTIDYRDLLIKIF